MISGSQVGAGSPKFAEERVALRSSACALWIFAAATAFATVHQQARADSDTWAEFSDVAQYVPLAWAAARTLQDADTEGALQLGVAGVATVGTSELLKRTVRKKRPDYRPGDRKRSFPSGHVAKAWFSAAHLQRRYGCYELEWSCWRGSAVPYLAAVATAVARVRARRHHLEDVIASAALAEAWVLLTTDRFDGEVRIAPTLDGGVGIAVLMDF